MHQASLTLCRASLTLHQASLTLHQASLTLRWASLTLRQASLTLHQASLTLHQASLTLSQASGALLGERVKELVCAAGQDPGDPLHVTLEKRLRHLLVRVHVVPVRESDTAGLLTRLVGVTDPIRALNAQVVTW